MTKRALAVLIGSLLFVSAIVFFYRIFITPPACDLPAPQSLAFEGQTFTSATALWSPVRDAIGYQVRVENASPQSGLEEPAAIEINTDQFVTGTSLLLTDLSPDQVYRVNVYPVCVGGKLGTPNTQELETPSIIIADVVVMKPIDVNSDPQGGMDTCLCTSNTPIDYNNFLLTENKVPNLHLDVQASLFDNERKIIAFTINFDGTTSPSVMNLKVAFDPGCDSVTIASCDPKPIVESLQSPDHHSVILKFGNKRIKLSSIQSNMQANDERNVYIEPLGNTVIQSVGYTVCIPPGTLNPPYWQNNCPSQLPTFNEPVTSSQNQLETGGI